MNLFILVALFGLGVTYHDPHFKDNRTSIVHLFEWRWADIAAECERFLGPNGFGGVQVCTDEYRKDIVLFLFSCLQSVLLRSPLPVSTSCWIIHGGPGGRDISQLATTCAPDQVLRMSLRT